MISDVVSIAFNYFSNDQFTYEQAKIYCSENILSNLAALVNRYKLTSAELKEVDEFIRDDVL
jgi:putative flippase GtrA